MLKLLKFDNIEEVRLKMREIGVDPYGIEIMLPKTDLLTLEIDNLSSIAANILKQELLSLGADAALSRDSITGRANKSPAFIFGTYAQLNRLTEKLARQPFGLNDIGLDMRQILANCHKKDFVLKAKQYNMNLSGKAVVTGIVNVTPDSFSGDGLYDRDINYIVEQAQIIIQDGADIIDVGGESTRPGAKRVRLSEELKRVIPVIKALAKRIKKPISVDTYKSEVARQALDNGASIVNDISGLGFDAKMPEIIAKQKAAVVIMHIKGTPRNMQKNPRYQDLIGEITKYFVKSINKALECGINVKSIVIDPGIGFGKTLNDNLLILKRISEFKGLGYPLLIGVSRKSFIGNILNLPIEERLMGTAAAVSYAVSAGVNIARVHDVKAISQVVKIINAIQNVR